MEFFIFMASGGLVIGVIASMLNWWWDRDDKMLGSLQLGMMRQRIAEELAREAEVNKLIAVRMRMCDKRAREDARTREVTKEELK